MIDFSVFLTIEQVVWSTRFCLSESYNLESTPTFYKAFAVFNFLQNKTKQNKKQKKPHPFPNWSDLEAQLKRLS